MDRPLSTVRQLPAASAALIAAAVLAAVAGTGWLVADRYGARRDAHAALESRTAIAGRFVAEYVDATLAHQTRAAETLLAGRTVSAREIARAARAGGYPAALVVDGRGRALAAYPPGRDVVGVSMLDAEHLHIVSAVAGRATASGVVPAAGMGGMWIGLASPYRTPYGRRVFSPAYAVDRTPLVSHLRAATRPSGDEMVIVDASGRIVAASGPTRGLRAGAQAPRPARAGARSATVRLDGRAFRYASRPIAGTPWRLAGMLPESSVTASLRDGRRAALWALVMLLAAATVRVALAVARRRAAEDARADAERRFAQTFQHAPIGMALIDLAGRAVKVNDALCVIFDRSPQDVLGVSLAEVTHPGDRAEMHARFDALVSGACDAYTTERRYVTPSGDVRHALVSASLVRDPAGRPAYVVAQLVDLTERATIQAELEHLAEHDELTGAANRRHIARLLDLTVERCRAERSRAALLLVDLDHFKEVNDTLGHPAGDRLLVGVADAVAGRLRRGDTIGRLGGDEFAIVLSGAGTGEAVAVARDVLRIVRAQGERHGHGVPVTASVGVVAFDGSARAADEVLTAADTALYDSKRAGRDRWTLAGGRPRPGAPDQPRVRYAHPAR